MRRDGRFQGEGRVVIYQVAIRDCLERNHIAKLHVHHDHVSPVLHSLEIGTRGHVHYVERDQLLGPKHLVTVHGQLNPAVSHRGGLRGDIVKTCGSRSFRRPLGRRCPRLSVR